LPQCCFESIVTGLTPTRCVCPAVEDADQKERFRTATTLPMLQVSLSRWKPRPDAPTPPWPKLAQAAIWREAQYAGLRAAFAAPRQAVAVVPTGDDAVGSLLLEVGLERGRTSSRLTQDATQLTQGPYEEMDRAAAEARGAESSAAAGGGSSGVSTAAGAPEAAADTTATGGGGEPEGARVEAAEMEAATVGVREKRRLFAYKAAASVPAVVAAADVQLTILLVHEPNVPVSGQVWAGAERGPVLVYGPKKLAKETAQAMLLRLPERQLRRVVCNARQEIPTEVGAGKTLEVSRAYLLYTDTQVTHLSKVWAVFSHLPLADVHPVVGA
jgi:hypothetical protein